MGLTINNHMHINNEVPGKKYFPWQQTWLISMQWAYNNNNYYGKTPNTGLPPFERDPHALYPRQGLRFADPEGTHTIAAMDEGGIDVSVILPIDYDFSWGSQSEMQIEEKHEHQAQMVAKYLADSSTSVAPTLAEQGPRRSSRGLSQSMEPRG